MKKLLVLLSLCFMPMMVKANGVPSVDEYTVQVNNSEGAYCYNIKMDDDQKKLVQGELIENGLVFKVNLEERFNNEIYVVNSDNNCYIKLSDVKTINLDKFSLDKDNLSSVYRDAVILDSDVEVKDGPLNAYNTVGKLEKGAKVKLIYASNISSGWYYIEEDNVKGWICALNGRVGFVEDGTTMIAKDAEVYDIDGNIIGRLKEKSIVSTYYSTDIWSYNFYVETDEISGYVDIDVQSSEYKEKLYTIDKVIGYEKHEDAENGKIGESVEIPKGTVLDAKYANIPGSIIYPAYYLVSYNNKEYWIVNTENEHNIAKYINKTVKALKDFEIYEDMEFTSSILDIKNDSIVTVICETRDYYYVSVNDTKGFVKVSDNLFNLNEEIIIKDRKFSKQDIINISIGIVVGCVISSSVILIAINKKTKKE